MNKLNRTREDGRGRIFGLARKSRVPAMLEWAGTRFLRGKER